VDGWLTRLGVVFSPSEELRTLRRLQADAQLEIFVSTDDSGRTHVLTNSFAANPLLVSASNVFLVIPIQNLTNTVSFGIGLRNLGPPAALAGFRINVTFQEDAPISFDPGWWPLKASSGLKAGVFISPYPISIGDSTSPPGLTINPSLILEKPIPISIGVKGANCSAIRTFKLFFYSAGTNVESYLYQPRWRGTNFEVFLRR
jgi:hypothetical protein